MGKKAKARKARRAEAIRAADAVVDPTVRSPADVGSAVDAALVETASRLHSAAIHLVRRVAREDQKLGLSPARLSALSVLVFGGPRTVGHLATAERVTAPTMTRLVAAMEAEGLVGRTAHATDRRVVLITATAKGEDILRRGREQRVRALASALETASAEELATIGRATDVVERVLTDRPDH